MGEGSCAFTTATDTGEWSCPHDAVTDDRCVFHLSAAERAAAGIDDEEVSCRFAAAIEAASSEREAAFRGCDLGRLEVADRAFEEGRPFQIDLRGAEIEELVMTNCRIARTIRFDDAEIGRVSLQLVSGDGVLSFYQATVTGELEAEELYCRVLSFREGVFGSLSVDRSELSRLDARAAEADAVTVKRVSVAGECSFREAVIDGDARFEQVDVAGSASFLKATVVEDFAFADGSVWERAMCQELRVDGDAVLRQSSFEAEATFERGQFGSLDLRFGEFDARATFDDAVVDGGVEALQAEFDDLSCTGLSVGDDVSFTSVVVDGYLDCALVPAGDAEPTASFREATVRSGTIDVGAGGVAHTFRAATLDSVSLTGGDGEDPLESVAFENTTFGEFDFTSLRPALRNRGWALPVSGSDPGVHETTYLRAKNGARTTGDNDTAAEFFRQEMRWRRRDAYEQMRGGEGVERLRGGWQAFTNGAFAATCGYGERPSNVVASSAVVVVGFAGVYAWLLSAAPTLDAARRYLTFSLQTFVALVLGPTPAVEDAALQFAVALEAFVGAFFIALFVFTLTRTVQR